MHKHKIMIHGISRKLKRKMKRLTAKKDRQKTKDVRCVWDLEKEG